MERVRIGGKTQADVDAEAREEERVRVNDAERAYLRETDWVVLRAMEEWLSETGRLDRGFIDNRNASRARVT